MNVKDSKITDENLDWYINQPAVVQLELFRHYVSVALLMANQLFEDEVRQKAGEKYSHDEQVEYSRWGTNPGSIRIGEEKLKVKVPRLYDNQTHETISPEAYKTMKQLELPSQELMKKIIRGISQKDYESTVKTTTESFGLSQSTVSRAFIEESTKALEEFEKRDLGYYDFLAIMIDGKYLSSEQVVIALGITSNGDKIPLGFIHTTTENNVAVKGLLKDLIERNFRFSEGLLVVLDGSKGLGKAVKETFGNFCVVQRCQWHKRENVVSYLEEKQQEFFRRKLQRAYEEPDYMAAKEKLYEIRDDLRRINNSAANSLEEGLEETLTLHRLGIYEHFRGTLATTNSIESLNSMLGKYLRKIKCWVNASMKSRWMATSLLEAEKRMQRLKNYRKLYLLRIAIQNEINRIGNEKVA
jgi:putative transposase